MALKLSCAFATSLDTPEHTRIAESLGYERAWFYDSPALYPDVWVQLCRAAERTVRIGLGTGVLVPHLRHPMTNAAAIATLVDVAGAERVVVGIGTGFTACVSMGRRPLTWRYVNDYVDALRGLLRGEEIEWEGGRARMMHWPGYGAARPINVPFVFAAGGPKGIAAAQEKAEGVFGVFQPVAGQRPRRRRRRGSGGGCHRQPHGRADADRALDSRERSQRELLGQGARLGQRLDRLPRARYHAARFHRRRWCRHRRGDRYGDLLPRPVPL